MLVPALQLPTNGIGVMRFLQTEWHRHERDRNAWEIERQEMRARIASLEGAARRTSKTQNGQNKYIRLLENAVKAERAKAKGTSVDEGKEPNKHEKGIKSPRERRGLFRMRVTDCADML